MYDPKTARFLQEDTYTGVLNDPLSLNLYTYCQNNPILYIDPLGHIWKKSDKNLNDDAQAKIILLTTAELNAKPKAEKSLYFGNGNSMTTIEISNLKNKNINNLILLGCNTGHLDYSNSNPAATYSKKVNDGSVFASDGTVYVVLHEVELCIIL